MILDLPPHGMLFKQVERLNGAPITRLLGEAWTAADLKSPNQYSVVVNWDNSAIWLENTHGPVAVIVYSLQDFNKVCWINLSYTRPAFQRLGLFKYLYSRLKIIAKDKDMIKISGGISAENYRMQKVATNVGRYPEYIVYTENIDSVIAVDN